ncbi:MAG: glycerophosphodiester phosphodiesterase family protein [Bacteroidota bacterium]
MPSYVQAGTYYRDFADVEALAAYLRPDSEAGPLVSAHRGGPSPGYPENAVATFERSMRFGPLVIECDVRMTQDSVLVLLHDDTLDRTTTGTGLLADQPFDAVRPLLLRDDTGAITPFRVPTLDEALAWAEGRTVLTLDIKRGIPPGRVVAALERAQAADQAMVIVYTLSDAERYAALSPDLLISASARTLDEARALVATGIAPDRLLAFTGVGTMDPALWAYLNEQGIRPIVGTFGETDERAVRAGPEVYDRYLDAGVGMLATDAPWVAAQATAARR